MWLGLSQQHVDRAVASYRQGDCAAAAIHARSSLAAASFSPEGYEVLGFCRLRQGRGAEAERSIAAAGQHEPGNWEYEYGRALAQAVLGKDVPALEAAKARNPRGLPGPAAFQRALPSLEELERRRGPQPLD